MWETHHRAERCNIARALFKVQTWKGETKMVSRYRYGVSPIIRHPQGTYRVAYAGPERKLNHSILLWFRLRDGRYAKDEHHAWQQRELKKLEVRR